MRIVIGSLVIALVASWTIFALVQVKPHRDDIAVPVVISGLWIVGALGLVGLALWCVRDVQARRRQSQDPSNG